MAQTKEKYTPNSCFQVHFQNKSLLACYSSLSSYAQGQFSKCTWMIVHPDAFKDNSAVTHKALHQFRHIHHEYGSHFDLTLPDTFDKVGSFVDAFGI